MRSVGGGFVETPKIAGLPYANGTWATTLICANAQEPSSAQDVRIYYHDAAGQVTQSATLWSSSSFPDPPGLDKITLARDGSGLYELYGPPSAAVRHVPLGPNGATGPRRNVAVFPYACGGINWTSIRNGRAATGEVFTGVLTNATTDGAARFDPDGMGGWTCSLEITTPTTLPGGVTVEFVDETGAVVERTYATMSDFPPEVPQGAWDVTDSPPNEVVRNGTPLAGGGGVDSGFVNVDFNENFLYYTHKPSPTTQSLAVAASTTPESLARVEYDGSDARVMADFDDAIAGFGVNEAGDGTVATLGTLYRISGAADEVVDIEELFTSGDVIDGRTVATIEVGFESTGGPLSAFTVNFFDFSSDYFLAVVPAEEKVPALSLRARVTLVFAIVTIGLWGLTKRRAGAPGAGRARRRGSPGRGSTRACPPPR